MICETVTLRVCVFVRVAVPLCPPLCTSLSPKRKRTACVWKCVAHERAGGNRAWAVSKKQTLTARSMLDAKESIGPVESTEAFVSWGGSSLQNRMKPSASCECWLASTTALLPSLSIHALGDSRKQSSVWMGLQRRKNPFWCCCRFGRGRHRL